MTTGYEDDNEFFRSYLAGAVQEAWARCLPIWLERGRVNDLPRGVRRTRYLPSFETILGRRFVERFPHEHGFLLGRLQSSSEFEALCAFDLLDLLAQQSDLMPVWLSRCELPLPEQVAREVAADWIYRDHGLDTIGKLLSFDHHDQPPPAVPPDSPT